MLGSDLDREFPGLTGLRDRQARHIRATVGGMDVLSCRPQLGTTSMRRREFILRLGGAAASSALWPLPPSAQQAAKFQIGYLYPGPRAAAPPRIAAFLSGVRAGGVRADQVEIV